MAAKPRHGGWRRRVHAAVWGGLGPPWRETDTRDDRHPLDAPALLRISVRAGNFHLPGCGCWKRRIFLPRAFVPPSSPDWTSGPASYADRKPIRLQLHLADNGRRSAFERCHRCLVAGNLCDDNSRTASGNLLEPERVPLFKAVLDDSRLTRDHHRDAGCDRFEDL